MHDKTRFTDEALRSIATTGWTETTTRLASELESARATLARITALTYASDDGSEHDHDHGIGDGHDQCPACWAEDIRKALAAEGDNV